MADKLPVIFTTLGQDFEYRVLPSVGNEVLKSVVAQYNADQLLTQREQVSKAIKDQLIERLSDFHLTLDDVSITHLTFGKEFTHAIEQKQVAHQEAEMAKFIVQRAEHERQATVIKAEGEAKGAELISKALQQSGTGVIEVKRIDAARNIALILASSRNVTYLPGGGQNVLLSLPQ
jgi:prohibitin 1